MVLHKQNGVGLMMLGAICIGWAFCSFATAPWFRSIVEKVTSAPVQQSILTPDPDQAIAQFLGLCVFGAVAVLLGGWHLAKSKQLKRNMITLDFFK